MIKKYLLGIISILGLGLSFSSASYPAIGMTSQLSDGNTCVINEDLSINCEKSDNAFTNSWNGGGAKSISSIFWSEDGIGILHNNQISGYVMQGLIVDGFHICSGNTLSNIQGNGDFFATCPGGFETIGNYTYNQLIEKLQSKTPLYRWNSIQYAGTYLAIIYDDFYFGIGINGYGSSQPHLNGNFVSQNLGFSDSLTYSGINWNNNNIWERPGFHGGRGNNLNTYQCPTIKQLIVTYNDYGFNTGMCVTSSRLFSGGSFVDVTPVSIFDLYSSSDEYVSDAYMYGQYCESSVYNQSVCSEAFNGNIYKLNLFGKLPKDLGGPGGRKMLYKYCSLYNYPENATTCTLGTGVIGELGVEITNSDVVNALANGDYTIVTPATSGTVFDGDYTFSGDIISNIQNLYTKFTGLFKKQTSNTKGVLPTFILIPFIIIVLFKLFKK